MSFKCPRCGITIEQDQKFCGNCKTWLVWKDGQPRQDIGQAISRTGTQISRIGCGLLCILVLIVVFKACMYASQDSKTTTRPPASPRGKILLEVKSAIYERGYLRVNAVATNMGTVGIFSPAIKCVVLDAQTDTVLASESDWPAGTVFETFKPGQSAAIDWFIHVTGEPANCRYRFEAEGFELEVKFPK